METKFIPFLSFSRLKLLSDLIGNHGLSPVMPVVCLMLFVSCGMLCD